MKPKRYPERTCIGCGARRQKRELIRIVCPQGQFAVDLTGKQAGRGAYLCVQKPDADEPKIKRTCFETALARRAFERAFGQSVIISGEFEVYLD